MISHYTCNLCDALCGLNVTVDGERITDIRGDPDDPFSRGHTCPKGAALRELHEDPDRLRGPVRRTSSHRGWEAVSWDQALGEAATRLGEIRARHGRDAVGLYVGNPVAHSHRAALGAQLLTMALRTRNRFDANSQDGNPRLFACMQVYGDALSMPIPDVDRCDLLVILGANPAASNGSQMSLGDVRKRLGRIPRKILIDPRRTETAAWCDEHHFIRPGGDAAFLLALIHVLFEMERVPDLEQLASGADELQQLAARFPPERVAAAAGIDAAIIRRLARELRETPRAALYARIGASQNPFGPVANWLVEAVNLLCGNFDREGGVMFAQPAADVAPLGRRLIGNHWGRWRSRVRGLPEMLGALPSAVMAEEMETSGRGQIRGFVCLAGNPVLSTPNGPRLARALSGLDFFVAIDHYLNETSRHAHLVLPPAHLFESSNFNLLFFGLAVRNLARHDRPLLPRTGRDDWEIASELALRLQLPAGLSSLAARLARRARDLPDRVVDVLLRTGRHRLSLTQLAQHPHGLDLGPLRPCRHEKVHTPDGRVRLAPEPLVADLPRLDRWLSSQERSQRVPDELLLIGRRHLRSNNSWMHNLRSLTKGPSRSQLLMHPDDAAARSLADGARVEVESRTGVVQADLAVTDAVGRGVVSLPHGFGHGESSLRIAAAVAGPNMNALTGEVEPLLGTSILNGVPVRVRPV
jgi:anaerobic selenocysteine-containing dehydrogenase